MKKQAFLVLSSVSLFVVLLAGWPLYAQSTVTLKSDIPFDFVVADRSFPAGSYTVRSLSPNIVLVQSADYKTSGIVSTLGKQNGTAATKTKLVFRRYGKTHFLAELWTAGNNDGREIRECKAEREMIASMKSQEEKTSVAARLR